VKEIVLAALAGVGLVIAATLFMRNFEVVQRARMMVRVFVAGFVTLAAVYWVTPDDLYVFPAVTTVPLKPLGLLFACFLYTAGFYGGVLQLYNLADRGLSLRMLIDVSNSPRGTMMPADMVFEYSGGRGLSWMYRKRINGLLDAGLIACEEDQALITAKGLRVARVFALLKAFGRQQAHNVG
jgi:hypothetical protein